MTEFSAADATIVSATLILIGVAVYRLARRSYDPGNVISLREHRKRRALRAANEGIR